MFVSLSIHEVEPERKVFGATKQKEIAKREGDECLEEQLRGPVDAFARAKEKSSKSGRADHCADHQAQHRNERSRLIEVLVLVCAHPALLYNESQV